MTLWQCAMCMVGAHRVSRKQHHQLLLGVPSSVDSAPSPPSLPALWNPQLSPHLHHQLLLGVPVERGQRRDRHRVDRLGVRLQPVLFERRVTPLSTASADVAAAMPQSATGDSTVQPAVRAAGARSDAHPPRRVRA
eukprot:100636-Chlamydomonas_euryale.AAC.1